MIPQQTFIKNQDNTTFPLWCGHGIKVFCLFSHAKHNAIWFGVKMQSDLVVTYRHSSRSVTPMSMSMSSIMMRNCSQIQGFLSDHRCLISHLSPSRSLKPPCHTKLGLESTNTISQLGIQLDKSKCCRWMRSYWRRSGLWYVRIA